MQTPNRIFVLAIVLVAAALIGATVWTSVPVVPPVAKTELPAPMVGTFTGEYERGVPVYRLPAVTVSVSRVEPARMAQEEQFARK